MSQVQRQGRFLHRSQSLGIQHAQTLHSFGRRQALIVIDHDGHIVTDATPSGRWRPQVPLTRYQTPPEKRGFHLRLHWVLYYRGRVPVQPSLRGGFPVQASSRVSKTRFFALCACVAAGMLCIFLCGCISRATNSAPSVQFTVVPESDRGGSGLTEVIEGRVKGAKKGQQIVLFARSGSWFVQPFDDGRFTAIKPDSTWKNVVHLGTEYAALLVEPGYSPPITADVLPGTGKGVVAVAAVGALPGPKSPKKLRFSGYEWEVRQMPSDGGGAIHANSASNVWTDAKGWLHMRITREGREWNCAELSLPRSLGYGSYSFLVRPMTSFEPGTVLGFFTYDHLEPGQDHREIDIQLSQWGDPAIKNAQYVIQPYYVAANVFRFVSPQSARLTHSFRWEAGRVSYQTVQGEPGVRPRVIAEHEFTSGIPSPGNETVHLNLYVYARAQTPQQNGVEVVIEKFQYLP